MKVTFIHPSNHRKCCISTAVEIPTAKSDRRLQITCLRVTASQIPTLIDSMEIIIALLPRLADKPLVKNGMIKKRTQLV